MPRTELRQCEEHLRYCLHIIRKNAGLNVGCYLDSEHRSAIDFLANQDMERGPLVEKEEVKAESLVCDMAGCTEKGVWDTGKARYCYPHYLKVRKKD
jgi:hypothetical protein